MAPQGSIWFRPAMDPMTERKYDPSYPNFGNEIVALKKFTREDFDEISDAEMDILERTWGEFGHMTASQLRNYSHHHCPEYTETAGRIPISCRDVLEALGASDAEAELVDREISEFRREESALIG
jgi:hypothetical protein